MLAITDSQFEALVAEGIDRIPEDYARHIENLAFVVEDEPTAEQRRKMGLRPHQTLFGLYEGIPLTKRGSGYNLVLPDKITIFKNPILDFCRSFEELRQQVNHTIWHEVAHYFGLDHHEMDAIIQRNRRSPA